MASFQKNRKEKIIGNHEDMRRTLDEYLCITLTQLDVEEGVQRLVEEKIKDCHLVQKEMDKEAPAQSPGEVQRRTWSCPGAVFTKNLRAKSRS